MKKTVPPNLLDDDKSDPKVQLQQATAQLSQAQQVNQELMKHNSEMMDTIKTDQIKSQTDIQIANIRAAAQVEVAGLTAKLDMAKLDFQKWELAHTTAHEAGLQADQQQHEKELEDQKAQAAQEQQAQAAEQQPQEPANAGA